MWLTANLDFQNQAASQTQINFVNTGDRVGMDEVPISVV